MTKVKIEGLKVFPVVAAVIGEARAKAELFKLQGCGLWFTDCECLYIAFPWSVTSQGYGFWVKIFNGVNPYAE